MLLQVDLKERHLVLQYQSAECMAQGQWEEHHEVEESPEECLPGECSERQGERHVEALNIELIEFRI